MGGRNRSWGYASYNVDDEDDEKLSYTSYENSGRVNRYHDNGDGHHSHSSWDDKKDYEAGEEPNFNRNESGRSENPSSADGCYVTTACMHHYKSNFDDNCYELTILRWLRDNFASEEDKYHYYSVAPIIVEAITQLENSNEIFKNIYENIIVKCIEAIEDKKFKLAYNIYKLSMIKLEKIYAKPVLEQKLVLALKNIN